MATDAFRRRIAALSLMERVKRQETESRARTLGEIRLKMDVLERDRQALLQRITRESRADGVEGAAYLGRFIRAIRAEIERADTEIARLMPDLTAAEIALKDALGEEKTFEILRVTRMQEERARQKKREAARLDEIGRQVWQG